MRTEVPSYEPDTRRDDETFREQLWGAFLAQVRPALQSEGLEGLLHAVAFAMADSQLGLPHSFIEACRNFAETEHWSGVLSAIALAQRERERFHRECMDRR